MNLPPTHTLSDRFASIIEGLLRALTTQGRESRLCGALLTLLHKRLLRTRNRFTVLAARVRDGALPEVAPARHQTQSQEARPRPSSPPALLPRGFGWIIRMVPKPWLVNHWRAQLNEMLDDPELVAIVAVAPQMGRELRPLCHMLAIEPPPALALPRRPRRRRRTAETPRAKKQPTPEQVDARVARMSRLAFANLINPETENMGWRPPNRIGYARAPRRPKRN
jgi:hypothetical protein